MTPARAIAIATNRVYLSPLGRTNYQIGCWSPERNAWWETQLSDRHAAKAWYWQYRVRTALELLEVEDAEWLAWDAMQSERRGSWQTAVREIYKRSSKESQP